MKVPGARPRSRRYLKIQHTEPAPERLPIMEWFAYIYEQSRKRQGVEAVNVRRDYD